MKLIKFSVCVHDKQIYITWNGVERYHWRRYTDIRTPFLYQKGITNVYANWNGTLSVVAGIETKWRCTDVEIKVTTSCPEMSSVTRWQINIEEWYLSDVSLKTISVTWKGTLKSLNDPYLLSFQFFQSGQLRGLLQVNVLPGIKLRRLILHSCRYYRSADSQLSA